MLKTLKIITVSIVLVLLATPANAITYQEIEDNIMAKCKAESTYLSFGMVKKGKMLTVDTSDYVHCSLKQLIFFKKVLGHTYDREAGYYTRYKATIDELIEKHWSEKYQTADWVKVWHDLVKEIGKDGSGDNTNS